MFPVRPMVLCSVLFLIILFPLACSKDSKSPVGPGGGDEDWQIGRTSTYTVSGSSAVSVADTVSGAVFVLNPGATATLSVSPVAVGPELPLAGTRFHVDYTGERTITIRVPADPNGGDVFLLSHGALDGAAVDEMNGNTAWWAVSPSAERDGVLEYTVTLEPPATARVASGATGANNFAIVGAVSGSGDFNHLRTINQTVNQVIDAWIDNLPADLQENARRKVRDLPWTVMWTSGGNAYKHVTSIFSPRVILYFNTRAQLMSIAHETGHYLCHALLGTARYNEIYNRFPTDFWGGAVAHDLGMYREGRKDMLEDYPYISMLLTTGDVDNYDLTSVSRYNHVRDMTGSADPASVDYPSHEAFGAAMLASLLRTADTIHTFSNVSGWDTARVPVVGAPWSGVLGILARGPRDPNELRSMISDYLASRGPSDAFKLPAMMEPLGWSYHGTGKVVDEKGEPLTGATVQPVSQDGAREYILSGSAATGADGKFTLPRIFPGSNLLRVFTNSYKDSVDFPVTVEWETSTSEAVDLGELMIAGKQKVVPLDFSHDYVLTPGIRAQNRLSVSLQGDLTGPEGISAYPQATSSVLDIQSVASIGQEMVISLNVNHTLQQGNSWTTSLSQGDYAGATRATTTLTGGRLKLTEYIGPDDTKNETMLSPGTITIRVPAPKKNGEYYRADLRLEWDYTQTYYDMDGGVVGEKKDKAGVNVVHIYRNVRFVW